MQLFMSSVFNHMDRMKDTLLPAPSVCTSDEFLWNIVRPIDLFHLPTLMRNSFIR